MQISVEICFPNIFIEILPLELRLLNSKWLILGTYKASSQNESTYQKLLTYYRSSHDNILLLGDFICHFLKKIWRTCVIYLNCLNCVICLNWIISLKTQHVSKAQTPHVLVISILTKRHFLKIHLLSRQTFLTTIVWFMLRSTFCKGPAKCIYYRSYSNYHKEQLENVLKQRLVSSSNFE